MVHESVDKLEGWVRTTWHPYLAQIPEGFRNDFVGELVFRYLKVYPVDMNGYTNVKMIRLEVEAIKLV